MDDNNSRGPTADIAEHFSFGVLFLLAKDPNRNVLALENSGLFMKGKKGQICIKITWVFFAVVLFVMGGIIYECAF